MTRETRVKPRTPPLMTRKPTERPRSLIAKACEFAPMLRERMPVAAFQIEGDRRARRSSIGDAYDGKFVVHAKGLATRASQRPEVDLYAIVSPQMRVRCIATVREYPTDNIAGIVDTKCLANRSSWIKIS